MAGESYDWFEKLKAQSDSQVATIEQPSDENWFDNLKKQSNTQNPFFGSVQDYNQPENAKTFLGGVYNAAKKGSLEAAKMPSQLFAMGQNIGGRDESSTLWNAARGYSFAHPATWVSYALYGSNPIAATEKERNKLTFARAQLDQMTNEIRGTKEGEKAFWSEGGWKEPVWYAERFAELAPSLTLQLASAAGGGVGMAVMTGAQTAASQYEAAEKRLLSKGVAPEKAAKEAAGEALKVGIVTAAIDKIGFSKLFSKAGSSFTLKKGMESALTEAVTETAQEFSAMVSETGTDTRLGLPDANQFTWENVGDRLAPSGVLGAITGPAFGGSSSTIGDVTPRIEGRYSLTPEDATRLVRENPEAAQAVAQSSRAGVNDFARWGVERGQGNRKEATAQRKKFQEEVKRELDAVAAQQAEQRRLQEEQLRQAEQGRQWGFLTGSSLENQLSPREINPADVAQSTVFNPQDQSWANLTNRTLTSEAILGKLEQEMEYIRQTDPDRFSSVISDVRNRLGKRGADKAVKVFRQAKGIPQSVRDAMVSYVSGDSNATFRSDITGQNQSRFDVSPTQPGQGQSFERSPQAIMEKFDAEMEWFKQLDSKQYSNIMKKVRSEIEKQGVGKAANVFRQTRGIPQTIRDAMVDYLRGNLPEPQVISRQQQEAQSVAQPAGPETSVPNPNQTDVPTADTQAPQAIDQTQTTEEAPVKASEKMLARRIARALPGDTNANTDQVLQQLRQDPEGLKQELEGKPGAESLIQKIEGYQEKQVAQQERQPDEIGFPTAGFGAAINLRVGKRTVTQEIMHHFKGMMTSLGHSPELIQKLADTKSMNLNNEIFLAKQNERRYRQALKQEFGKSFSKLDKPVQDTLENLIHDKQLPQMQWSPQIGISEDLFITMKAMRNSIDTLSEKVIGTGRLNEDTEKIYEAGKGKYTIRQYRMYEDSKYRLRNVPEEILNNAIDWFQQNLPNNVPKTREHITNLIDAFLNTKGKTDIKVKGGGGDGVMDLTAMLKRDESIPVQLRDLMGEFKDPGTNYIKSVEKLANILETYRFQDDLAQLGKGVFLFSREDADLPAGMKIIGDIKDPRSAAKLGPLNGLYTTPEIAQIIEGQPIVKINNLALKLLAYGSTGAKLAKTVYSVQSVTRNFLSGFNFLLKNGSNPIVAAKALKEAIAFVSADIKSEFTQKALDEKWEAKVMEWQAFLGEEVNTNEIRELFERTRGERNFKFFDSDRALNLLENPVVEKLNAGRKRFHNLAMKFYLHGDTVWKIAQYEVEKSRLKKYRTDLSDAEIQAEAAEITKNVMPTYSRVFQWVKSLRRSPFLASFPSFAAEMIRNDKNIFRQSMKEIAYAANATGAAADLKSGNIPAFMVKVASHPAGRIGLSRAGGLAMASVAGPALLAALFKMENEVSDEEDRAIRELDPFWSRNGWWLYWGKDENGFNRRVDLSYMHTDQSIIKPLIALAVNNDPTDALREAQEPFLGLDLHFDALIEALSGFDDEKGRELYQSSDTGFEKGVKGAAHYSEVLIPGTATTVKQILDSLNGKVRRDGKIITPTEAFMSIAGVKRFSNDPTVQVGFSANAFKRSMSDAKGEFYSKAKSRGDESEDALVSAFVSMETSRERAFNTMKKKFDAAVTLSNTRDVLNALSQKLTKEEQQRLMANAFEEWRPSDRFWEGVPPRKREVVASAIQKARAELQDRKALQESGISRMPQ